MNRSSRFKQTAVIVMAIIVVILVLWRLHSRPGQFGGAGGWARTNIFGPTTLGIISGSEPGGGEFPPQSGTNSQPTNVSGSPAPVATNHPPTNQAAAGSRQTLSTNLLNTNGPVTVIAVPSADLVQTPPGVTAASNVSDAANIEQLLGQASAKSGDIQFSLSWNNYNDLDLHCIDPRGEEIWFSHPISRSTQGQLDVDQNANLPFTRTPVENIFWPIGAAPPGLYRVFVVYYAQHGGSDPTAFTVRSVVKDWKTYFFKSEISFSGRREGKLICTLQYDPANADPAQRFRFVQ